jgi:hypothetical protein
MDLIAKIGYIIAGVMAILVFMLCMVALFRIITKDLEGHED